MKNKGLIITGIFLLVIALIILLIAGYLANWDFKTWFTSRQAIWVYVIVGLYGIGVLGIYIAEKIKGL